MRCGAVAFAGVLLAAAATTQLNILHSCHPPSPQQQHHNTPPGSFTETELGEVKFPEINTAVLEKVCQYFYYKLRYQNS